jgi:DNA/RNA-binding domain of Phe-tRNA-synthetase-like protein
MTIRVELEGVRLAVVEAEGVRVGPSPPELQAAFWSLCDRLARELTVDAVAQLESVQQVRAMFRAWGLDPSKYRPAAEALLRRLAQGRGLRSISNVVDIVNLGSLETGWPYGCYDRQTIEPPVELRLGRTGEVYEGIGRRVWHLAGRPVLADRHGPFGSPISDSTRTQVAATTRDVLVTLFAPAGAPAAAVEGAAERLRERLIRWAGAERAWVAV